MSRVISDKQLPIRVVYRPHPWRAQPIPTTDEGKGVVFRDPQCSADWGAMGPSSTDYPELTHLVGLLSHARALFSPMSSVLVEGLLLGLPVAAMCHKDDHNPMTPHVISQFTHFDGLLDVPSATACESWDRLEQLLVLLEQQLVLAANDPSTWDWDHSAILTRNREILNGGILTNQPGTYADRVMEAVSSKL